MSSNAESIRSYAAQFVERARRAGQTAVTIGAGQIVKELHLNNRVPAVCSALASKAFQEQNRIVLERREGPPSGQSTTTKFTYRLTDTAPAGGRESELFASLRGAGKDVFQKLGGGEAFLKKERQEMDRK